MIWLVEVFLERPEPDLEFGDDLLRTLAADPRAEASGREEGIVLHVHHDREKLVGRVSERLLLLVMRHVFSCLGFQHGAPSRTL